MAQPWRKTTKTERYVSKITTVKRRDRFQKEKEKSNRKRSRKICNNMREKENCQVEHQGKNRKSADIAVDWTQIKTVINGKKEVNLARRRKMEE